MIWQAFQTLVPVDAAGSGVNAYSIIFGRQRPQLVDPAGRLGRADGGAHALPRGSRLDRALQPAGVAARARGRALHRRRDRRRRALPGAAAPCSRRSTSSSSSTWRRARRGARSSSTASTPTTWACPGWPATWPPTRPPSSRRRTARAPPSRPGTVGWPEEVLDARARRARPAPVRPGRAVAARGHADARGSGPRAARATTRSSC